VSILPLGTTCHGFLQNDELYASETQRLQID